MQDSVRRLVWRLGRNIYSKARGEPADGDIGRGGEAYVQRRVIAGAPAAEPLRILDIGANLGEWTLSFLKGHSEARRKGSYIQVHLFEPVPFTRQRLEANLFAAQPAAGVAQVHGMAVSDLSGRASMQIVGDTSGRNSLVANELSASGVIEFEVATLVDVFARFGIDRAQLVKVDAEGHDRAIVLGARDLLVAGRIDVLQFEYNHTWVFSRSFLKDIFDVVEGLPYSIARIRPQSVEVFDAWHPELDRFFHCNYLLIRQPALAWFDVVRGRFDVSNTYA